ncbi:3-deoxy-D-manno-octulosonic-acid transferase [compost metagenome]
MREAGALEEVEDAEGLHRQVRKLLRDPVLRRRMDGAGVAVLKGNQGALERLLGGLRRFLQHDQM